MKKLQLLLTGVLFSGILGAQTLTPFEDETSGKWGYKNDAGETVIDPQWDEAGEFMGDFASIEIEGWAISGIINRQGEVIANFGELFEIEEQKRAVFEDVLAENNLLVRHPFYGSFCILDENGGIVKDWTQGNAEPTENGDVLIHTIEDDQFEGNRSYDTKVGLIDHNGKVILAPEYTFIQHVQGDRFIACKGEWKMYDEKESLKLMRKMISPVRKKEEWRVYRLEGSWGVIDVAGNEVLPFDYMVLRKAYEEPEILGSKVCGGWYLIQQDNRGRQGARESLIQRDGTSCAELSIPFADLGL